MRSHQRAAIFAGLGIFLVSSLARATFHEWKISELYSNSSGTVQFIEFQLPGGVDDESFVQGQQLNETSLGHSFNFPSNLPVVPPANGFMLVATPGYAALSGVPTADYVLPINNFFNVAGDTINYSFVDTLSFTSAQMPTNGAQSLNRTSYGSTTFASQTNSPTNVHNQTGSVPEPAAISVIGAAAMWMLRRK